MRMKMERFTLILVLALSGCSALVNSALEDGDGGADAGVDAALFDCRRIEDGTPCGENQICISNLCESSRCGDGFVSGDEQCDELDEISGDGCEPSSCRFSCTESADCDDGNPCSVNTCADNVCGTVMAANGNACESLSGIGTCSNGLCISEGCGDGVVDVAGGEQCDDNSAGCVACQFVCENDDECRDGVYCNGEETCNVSDHVCVPGTPLTCDDGDECTADACSESSQTCLNPLIDPDGDGYADVALDCSDADQGGDCDSEMMAINPGAAELCDGVDNNCNGQTDETSAVMCFPDRDNDGYGGGRGTERNCRCEPGEISTGGDCNDESSSAKPYQTSFFPRPHCGGSVQDCFDYNCNGDVERRFTAIGVCERPDLLARYCVSSAGWQASAPNCGASATWISGCTLSLTNGCVPITMQRTQECR